MGARWWATTVACIALGIACDAFTPNVDPRPFPCGNPQMHFCPVLVDGERTCCFDGEDCGGSPEFPGCPRGACCNARGLSGAARDAGEQ